MQREVVVRTKRIDCDLCELCRNLLYEFVISNDGINEVVLTTCYDHKEKLLKFFRYVGLPYREVNKA